MSHDSVRRYVYLFEKNHDFMFRCELRDDKTETYLRTIQEKMNDRVLMVGVVSLCF